MVTRFEQIFRMRDGLDNPYPNKPSFHQLLRQEISEEMDVVNATLVTGKPWATQTYQLNYAPNQDTYSINVSDWGKVLYVVRITGNVYLPYVTVPFDDVNDQQYGSVWTNWSSAYGTFFQPDETPEHMSFYREGVLDSQIMVKIQPMPMQAWQYLITYLPGYIGTDDPLESAIQLPEHAELVRLRGQMALLPYSQWYEDDVRNANKRKELAMAYEYQLNRPGGKESLFKRYVSSISIPKSSWISDWNGDY